MNAFYTLDQFGLLKNLIRYHVYQSKKIVVIEFLPLHK